MVHAPMGRVENPETDSQGCSTDFGKGTEAVQGEGELLSGTRAIGHLSKITKEPQQRLHFAEKLTQREGIMNLNVKYKSTTFRKIKGENLWLFRLRKTSQA